MDKLERYIEKLERSREQARSDVERFERNIGRAERILDNTSMVKDKSPLMNRLNCSPDLALYDDPVFIKLGAINGDWVCFKKAKDMGYITSFQYCGGACTEKTVIHGVKYHASLEMVRRTGALMDKIIYRQMNEIEYQEVAEKSVQELILVWDDEFAKSLKKSKRRKVA